MATMTTTSIGRASTATTFWGSRQQQGELRVHGARARVPFLNGAVESLGLLYSMTKVCGDEYRLTVVDDTM